MTEIRLTSEISVRTIDAFGGDRLIAETAWLTTGKSADTATDEDVSRLIRMLMKDGHGSPFEFSSLVFEVHAPLFVFRQLHRHRMASYSEVSARWHRPGNPPPLEPVFWVPRRGRPMAAAPGHKPTAPRYAPLALDRDYDALVVAMRFAYQTAWSAYETAVENGIASEVARAVLPLAVYTRCRAMFNPRSLMNLLSKRVNHPQNRKPTSPQLETQEMATACELAFEAGWPLTYKAFCENGRMAP